MKEFIKDLSQLYINSKISAKERSLRASGKQSQAEQWQIIRERITKK